MITILLTSAGICIAFGTLVIKVAGRHVDEVRKNAGDAIGVAEAKNIVLMDTIAVADRQMSSLRADNESLRQDNRELRADNAALRARNDQPRGHMGDGERDSRPHLPANSIQESATAPAPGPRLRLEEAQVESLTVEEAVVDAKKGLT